MYVVNLGISLKKNGGSEYSLKAAIVCEVGYGQLSCRVGSWRHGGLGVKRNEDSKTSRYFALCFCRRTRQMVSGRKLESFCP